MTIKPPTTAPKMLAHRADILAAEASRLAGAPIYTQDDLDAQVEELLTEL